MSKYYHFFLFLSLFLSSHLANATEDKVCILNGPTEETATFMSLFANDQGLLKKNGLKLETLHTHPRRAEVMTLEERIKRKQDSYTKIISDKNCDFIVLSFEKILIQDQAVINDYKVLLSSYYGTNYDTNFIVKKGSKITSLKDLENKTIRLGQMGSILAFKNMMAKENLSTDSIKAYEIDSVKVLDSLKQNKIAMGSTYFPTMQVALASGEVEILRKNIFKTYLDSPYPQSIVLVKKSTLKSKPEVVAKYKTIMNDLLKTTNKSPMVLAKTLRKHTKDLGMDSWNVTDAQIEKGEEQYTNFDLISENDTMKFNDTNVTPKEIFTKTQTAFKNAKMINHEVDLNTLF